MLSGKQISKIIIVLTVAVWLTGCGAATTSPDASASASLSAPGAEPTVTGGTEPATAAPTITATAESTATAGVEPTASTIVETRQPQPTPQPGPIQEEVNRLVESNGLQGKTILGLPVSDWLAMLLGIFTIALGYGACILLLRLAYRIARQYVPDHIVDSFRLKIGRQIRRTILVWLVYLGVLRLGFINEFFRQLVLDITYILGMLGLLLVLWRMVTFIRTQYLKRISDKERESELEPAAMLISRMAHVIIAAVIVSMILDYFGINIIALSAAVGLGGLALSLAARETIEDTIAGIVILFDRPFRVGDRIEIDKIDTWGDVVDIGMRTTRIRTRDNRLVIIPNANIVENEIVNYTYPDPHYRLEMDIQLAYNYNIDKLKQLIIETTSKVDGVIADRGVDALYLKMGGTGMVFRIRWWIVSYEDTRRMMDRVNTALQEVFNEHGIVPPSDTMFVAMTKEETLLPKTDV